MKPQSHCGSGVGPTVHGSTAELTWCARDPCPADGEEKSQAMEPVVFSGRFGWLHSPIRAVARSVPIVVCAGIGRDANTGYRGLRQLARQLSQAGFSVLRFDYAGAGNSLDSEDGEYWSVWLDDVRSAIRYVCARSDARQVILLGFRAGATLAASVAVSDEAVIGLALLEPVVRGKSYITQLRLERELHLGGNALPPAEKDLQSHGFLLSERTLAWLAQIDLATLPLPPNLQVGLFSQAQSKQVGRCSQAWSERGLDTVVKISSGLSTLMAPCHTAASKREVRLQEVIEWITAMVPPAGSGPERILAFGLAGPPIETLQWKETPLRFGASGAGFGVLCHPRYDATGKPVIVILNTGGEPHHGHGRFSVELARLLAVAGFASLRTEFSGLGDAAVFKGGALESGTQVFAVERQQEISAAIDQLVALGYEAFALFGLCSGAYHAFHAAVADRRVGFLLAINLPRFTIRFEKAGSCSVARTGIAGLARRRVRTLLLFGPGDPGLAKFGEHYDAAGFHAEGGDAFEVRVCSGFDHELTRMEMRRDAADMVLNFLEGRSTGAGVSEGDHPCPSAIS